MVVDTRKILIIIIIIIIISATQIETAEQAPKATANKTKKMKLYFSKMASTLPKLFVLMLFVQLTVRNGASGSEMKELMEARLKVPPRFGKRSDAPAGLANPIMIPVAPEDPMMNTGSDPQDQYRWPELFFLNDRSAAAADPAATIAPVNMLRSRLTEMSFNNNNNNNDLATSSSSASSVPIPYMTEMNFSPPTVGHNGEMQNFVLCRLLQRNKSFDPKQCKAI